MGTYMHTRFAATDPSLADLFTSLRDPILRADFLRYLILLRDGGVWADINVYPHRPVAEWVPERFRGRLAQYTVLAKPGHPAVGVLVEEVTGNLRRLVGEKGRVVVG
ncbi:hypothetical protein CHGG_09865 [Chaetomium globosum CBS 148.51]|uniref:Alpha 1,4-glycosyltransferase domain-containing protein n=1 Tax=Chaetomium globosum (strain ATCC 6205 / CBS 148.51 / DSM 1962 / NBRC 6347 / NRRL 1970) TaxID=306901 RepID=Q2GQ89_CHAGB|nr:uncharacterized protein CHGG_09865 [Chaetomium globosum CBS 148.51]EAQ83461.1 hypothetical protein CHGG_09865 [Chaetomium globosum CBS 148.51]